MSENSFLSHLNNDMEKYFHEYYPQFHLKLPRGKIKKINEYRDYYFPYIADSVYKSNLCYLLQLLDYQLLLYRTFQPGLSLENSFFYQQIITMGIITESTATAILLDPFIITNPKDRSLGNTDPQYIDITHQIVKNSFVDNIRIMRHLNILSESDEITFQEIRKDIRNLVHIQNWEKRIYQSMDFDFFNQRLTKFKNFLLSLKEHKNRSHTVEEILTYFQPEDSNQLYNGIISEYFEDRGFGFIKTYSGPGKVFFHINRFPEYTGELTKGKNISVRIKKSSQGYEAVEIILDS